MKINEKEGGIGPYFKKEVEVVRSKQVIAVHTVIVGQ